MKRLPSPLLVALGLVLSWQGSVAALDFTPVEKLTVEDGMPMRRLSFRDGEKPIFFQLPQAWTIVGGGDEITFLPPSPLVGEVRMGNSKLDPAIRFDEEGLAVYRAAARRVLPQHAQNVEILSETPDAFPFDNWQSFEMRLSYTLLGAKKVRSVLFVTMNPQRQIRLVADGDEKEFEAIYGAARTLLGSWFEPPAGWPGMAALQAP